MVISVVNKPELALTETFIRAHLDRLPAETNLIHGFPPRIEGETRKPKRDPCYLIERAAVKFGLISEARARTNTYRRLLRRAGADLVLAEFGTAGVVVMEAARLEDLPLVVYFRGYDASRQELIEEHLHSYRQMFRQAAALVAVSRPIRERLISWGADPEKVYYSPSGVDCSLFTPAGLSSPRPTFLFVGRFVPKKAPHLTLWAFRKVLEARPDAELRMIGEGPLEGPCQDLAEAMGISESVVFLGAQPHRVVREEMQEARAYVQHSLTAQSGDSEGLPVSILEAGACGLPVISTRHAGIPDAVVHEKTGLLVEERDTDAMADYMKQLAEDRALARKLGSAARERITAHFTMEQSIDRLWRIIKSAVDPGAPPVSRLPEWVESAPAHEPT